MQHKVQEVPEVCHVICGIESELDEENEGYEQQ